MGEGEKSGERVGRGWESGEMEGTRWGERGASVFIESLGCNLSA